MNQKDIKELQAQISLLESLIQPYSEIAEVCADRLMRGALSYGVNNYKKADLNTEIKQEFYDIVNYSVLKVRKGEWDMAKGIRMAMYAMKGLLVLDELNNQE